MSVRSNCWWIGVWGRLFTCDLHLLIEVVDVDGLTWCCFYWYVCCCAAVHVDLLFVCVTFNVEDSALPLKQKLWKYCRTRRVFLANFLLPKWASSGLRQIHCFVTWPNQALEFRRVNTVPTRYFPSTENIAASDSVILHFNKFSSKKYSDKTKKIQWQWTLTPKKISTK